ncbi:MAG TPA: flagellar type III secretion system pore protein FliP [Gemmataceae bacterium]|nr:flagellar type III secretion system pore protein FliP [Gemmataceae bacterium]
MSDFGKLLEHLGQSGVAQNLSPPLQTGLFLGALALLPAALVSLTAFTRIVIVLSFLRRAVTAQEIPPNMVTIGLALFLTFFVMGPTWEEISAKGLTPYLDGKMSGVAAFEQGTNALHKFMLRQTRRQDLALFLHMAHVTTVKEPADTPFRVLVPAFMISELKTAFIMGFSIYLPFLVVDLVVASVLTSMGMVMMPPVVISAPFKILLFVIADGWHLVARALSLSFH